MFQSLMLFLAPTAAQAANEVADSKQAVQSPPRAAAMPAAARAGGRLAALRFLATMIGNAVGFAALFTGCWLTLRLLQVFL